MARVGEAHIGRRRVRLVKHLDLADGVFLGHRFLGRPEAARIVGSAYKPRQLASTRLVF